MLSLLQFFHSHLNCGQRHWWQWWAKAKFWEEMTLMTLPVHSTRNQHKNYFIMIKLWMTPHPWCRFSKLSQPCFAQIQLMNDLEVCDRIIIVQSSMSRTQLGQFGRQVLYLRTPCWSGSLNGKRVPGRCWWQGLAGIVSCNRQKALLSSCSPGHHSLHGKLM
jgi:hypothetical protein